MKKLFSALILCTVMLCGCSASNGDEISETAVSETSSVTVTTESSAETTTTTAATTTAKETAVREPAEKKIVLTPIPSEEPFEVMACGIIDNMVVEKEEDFYNMEALKLAREVCFADEDIHRIITEANDDFTEEKYGENAANYIIETAEDIPFICGLRYDFDGDREYEYVISLQYYATYIGMDGSFVIYIDDDKYEILIDGGNPVSAESIKIISSGYNGYNFLLLHHTSGMTWYGSDIYSFESGLPQKVTDCDYAKYIRCENGVFYCELKYGSTYPFILCGDGKFRQLGREKISREDFEKHVQNGGKYLDSLAEKDDEVTEIYTYGYYSYELYGEDFRYDVNYVNNDFYKNRYGSDSVNEEFRFTDEAVYGDVWAVQTTTRSRNYDIGGGYVCYKTGKGKNEILNVVKDNVITDSINLNDMCFDPDWQINFYDMDTPPCFALEVGSFISIDHQTYYVGSIYYRTYFVIDGKITEMNWTLDGERLDTVDYTMLQCRGEGDEFVSYSIPVWENDRFTKRRFTFAEGNYTNIVGYSEDIEDKITKEYNANLHGYVKHGIQLLDEEQNAQIAYETLDKFCIFWGNAYNAYGSVTDDNKLWLRLEKEGFRTKEEMLKTISEFCTPTAAKEYYSMIVEGKYSDFKVINGRIYTYDGAPSSYLPYYFIESAEEKDGVITARLFAYYVGQDIPYRICPPLYAEFVRENGVWKISSLPKEKQTVTP